MENNISIDEHIKKAPEKKVKAKQTFSTYYRDFSRNKKAKIITACIIFLLIIISTVAFAVYARNKEDSAMEIKTKTTPTPRKKSVKKTPTPSPKKTPTKAPSPTAAPTSTSAPTPTNTPAPRNPNPPKFKITSPKEGEAIIMSGNQKFCVKEEPDGGDHAGSVMKREKINDSSYTEYKKFYETCFDPQEGANNIKLQYKNPFGDEIEYSVNFTFQQTP